MTGDVCSRIVTATLQSAGVDVVDTGLATTPTVEMAVLSEGAAGGIVLSASHNPAEWNALKLLNGKGEFLSPEEGQAVIALAEEMDGESSASRYTVSWDGLGSSRSVSSLSDDTAANTPWGNSRPMTEAIWATSFTGASRSSRAINEAWSVLGMASERNGPESA